MPLSPYLANGLLEHVMCGRAFAQPKNLYVALHIDAPGAMGKNELSGGGYARKLVATLGKTTSFALAKDGIKQSNIDIEIPSLPASRFSHIALWDAPSGGNMLSHGELDRPVTVSKGDAYRIHSGKLAQVIA